MILVSQIRLVLIQYVPLVFKTTKTKGKPCGYINMAGLQIPVDLIIKFRKLYNQINDLDSIMLFHKQMIQKFGKEIFIGSLCTDFYITKHGNDIQTSCFPIEDKQYIQKMTEKIEYGISKLSKIIQHKNSNNNNNNKKNPQSHNIPEVIKGINIQQLPSIINNKIASYLKQRYYIAYSTTCREIYIACNSPNTLIKLSILHAAPCQPIIGILRFRNVEVLSLTMTEHIIPPVSYKRNDKLPIFKTVKRLCLDNQERELTNYSFISNMISDNVICMNEIKEISLKRFGTIQFGNLIKLVTNLKHIECLEFRDSFPIPPLTTEEKQQFIDRFDLTSFAIFNDDEFEFTNFIIHHYGNDIEKLKLQHAPFMEFQHKDNFLKLNNLHLIDPEHHFMNQFLVNNQLTSFTLDFNVFNKDDIRQFDSISSIFIQQKEIKRLIIRSIHTEHFHFIFDVTEKAINKSNLYKNDNLLLQEITINIIIGDNEPLKSYMKRLPVMIPFSLEDIMIKLTRILNELLLFNFTKTFTLKFQMYGKFIGDLKTEISHLTSKYNQIEIFNKTKTITENEFTNINLVIMNKSNIR